jgi:hypothetical protein
MPDKKDIIEQTRLAFDFLQRLYIEASYLIKEIEGILKEEEEKFIIGRPAGYSISARSSTGLEANNVALWLLRKFAVFFVPENRTKQERGQTITTIDKTLKILYLRIVLNDNKLNEPAIYSGALFDMAIKQPGKWIKKFENAMGHLEYNDEKMFKVPEQIDYEDAYIKLRGEFIKNHLFDINDSQTIVKKIIKPSLELYRSIGSV